MRRAPRRIRLLAHTLGLVAFLAGPLLACGALLGLDDIAYDAADAGATLDASSGGDSAGESALDGGAADQASADALATDAAQDGPFSVAVGLGLPQALAIDQTNLYWLNSIGAGLGSVQSMRKDGTGPMTTYATNQPSPLDIAVAGDSVYWSVNQSPPAPAQVQCLAMTTSKDGGAPACVTSGAFASVRMTTNGAYVVVLSRAAANDFIGFGLPDGGYQNVQAQGVSQAITATSTNIFLGNPNGIHIDELTFPALGFLAPVCTSGCGATTILDITVDVTGASLLWITQGGVFTEPTAPTNATGTQLATLPAAGQRIARDASYAYVTTAQSVIAVPLSGKDAGAPVLTLASGEASPFGIAVDDEHVYWTDGNGSIRATSVPAPP